MRQPTSQSGDEVSSRTLSAAFSPTVIVVSGLAALVLLVTMLRLFGVGGTSRQASVADRPSVYPTAPPAEILSIHAALHDMATRCKPSANVSTQRAISSDVDLLIAFARRYPNAQFTVDDEEGRSLDLLLVARSEMRICAPTAAERANQALPPWLRTPSAGSPASVDTAPGVGK